MCIAPSGRNFFDIHNESDRGMAPTEMSLCSYHYENFEGAMHILKIQTFIFLN